MFVTCIEFPEYSVSRDGAVRNNSTGRVLAQGLTSRGYPFVSLWTGSPKKSRNATVHRLLGKAFIPNPDNKPEINHIDGVKTNYSLNNLEWVTHRENVIHAWANGLASSNFKHHAGVARGPMKGRKVVGVYFDKHSYRAKPYKVTIRRYGKSHNIGYYATEKEAIEAQQKALSMW